MISGCRRVEMGVRDEQVEHRGLLGQWKYSEWYHDDGNVIHLSKLTECKPGVNPNINYGLWVTMMCQSRSVSCSKCIIWWGMLVVGKPWSVRTGGIWETSAIAAPKSKKVNEILIRYWWRLYTQMVKCYIEEMERVFVLLFFLSYGLRFHSTSMQVRKQQLELDMEQQTGSK